VAAAAAAELVSAGGGGGNKIKSCYPNCSIDAIISIVKQREQKKNKTLRKQA
jgi:hypothetical protein